LVRPLLFRRATLFRRLPLHSPLFLGSLSALVCALLFYAATLLLLLNGPLAGGPSLLCGTLLFCRPTSRGFVCTCRAGGRCLRCSSSRPLWRGCVRRRRPRSWWTRPLRCRARASRWCAPPPPLVSPFRALRPRTRC